MSVLAAKEVKMLERQLHELYGCTGVLDDCVVLKTGREEKIWIAPKSVFQIDMQRLRTQVLGLYFGRLDRGVLRLSIEGCQIVGKTATRNVVEIEKQQLWDWLRGFDVPAGRKFDAHEGVYVLVRLDEDWLGMGKLVGEKLQNVLPKSRKLISLTKEKQEDLYVKADLVKI